MSLKLAVVAIAKNEEQFAARFLESCWGADYVIVADTGSTDPTIGALYNAWDYAPKSLELTVCRISVRPWRFDTARNAVLALCPDDANFVITLDLDEVLIDGWRGKIEKALAKTPNATRISYGYVWNHDADGNPLTQFRANRIYSRNGYRWVYPCHETLSRYDGAPEVFSHVDGVLIEHYADDAKPRSSYLPLLEMGVRENPTDRRCSLYLLREQLFTCGVTHDSALMFGRYAVSQGFLVEGVHALQLAATLAKTDDERIAASRELGVAHSRR